MGFHRVAAYVLLVLALLHPLGYVADLLFTHMRGPDTTRLRSRAGQ
jgi:hypothetical protein